MTRTPGRGVALPPALLLQEAPARPGDRPSGELITDAGEFIDLALDTAFRLLPRLALAVLILLVFVGLAYVARLLLRRVFRKTHLESEVGDLLLTLAKFVVIAFGAMLALENLGFNVTSIIAGLGIAGIALGFAAKDTLANLIAGITILWDRPFRVGDRIEVAGSTGVVRKITLRTTRLDTPRNEVVILPNETMVTEKIINHTMRPSLRVDIPFGIAYRHDVPSARQVLLAAVTGDEDIRSRPEPAVVVTELAASSVNLELRFWLKDPRKEIQIRLRYVEKVKEVLDGAGIEIPFPQLTLHVATDAVPLPEALAGGGERVAGAAGKDGQEASGETADRQMGGGGGLPDA